MNRVFVTQETTSVDYTPATKFGDLIFVTATSDRFSPHLNSLNNINIVNKIKCTLADFQEGDFLVCTGAPVNMALCGMVLGDKLKRILCWDNRMNDYFEVKV